MCIAAVAVTNLGKPKIESVRGNPEWLVYFLWYSFTSRGPEACIAWALLMIAVVLIVVRNPKEK